MAHSSNLAAVTPAVAGSRAIRVAAEWLHVTRSGAASTAVTRPACEPPGFLLPGLGVL